MEFELYQTSTYDFRGNLLVRELVNGDLELTLLLDGLKSSYDYSYPAHLHFGAYDQTNSTIAHLLTPVSAKNLTSVTVLGALSDGSKLSFESMSRFDGHIKIHLANEGPDYGVILVAGNVGPKSSERVDPEKMEICTNNF